MHEKKHVEKLKEKNLIATLKKEVRIHENLSCSLSDALRTISHKYRTFRYISYTIVCILLTIIFNLLT